MTWWSSSATNSPTIKSICLERYLTSKKSYNTDHHNDRLCHLGQWSGMHWRLCLWVCRQYQIRYVLRQQFVHAKLLNERLYDLTTIMVYRYMNSPAMPRAATGPPRPAPLPRPRPPRGGFAPRVGAIRGGMVDERQSACFKSQSGCSWESRFKKCLAGRSLITIDSERSESQKFNQKFYVLCTQQRSRQYQPWVSRWFIRRTCDSLVLMRTTRVCTRLNRSPW